MSAKTIEAARIAGALKCMDALRQLQQSAEAPGQDDTVEAYTLLNGFPILEP